MKSFPFDSQLTYDEEGTPSYDRAYDSEGLRNYLKLLFTDGVFPNPSTGLQVTTSDQTMSVTVQPGCINIQGALGIEDQERTLVLQAADTNYDRIDSVVARLDTDFSYRSIDLYVVQGTPETTPTAPELTQTKGKYELRLANVFVAKNTTFISGERITDTRLNSEDCGVVTGAIQSVDTTTIFKQYKDWFDEVSAGAEIEIDGITEKYLQQCEELVEQMQNLLSGDAAGELQVQINDLETQTKTIRDGTVSITQKKTTSFSDDGSIIETYADGQTKITAFKDDGSIAVTMKDASGEVRWTKTTSFSDDGSIVEEIKEG
jgi:hypothetical protein